MTEATTPPVVTPDPAAAGGSGAGDPPSGFVSEATLESERTRSRTFQSELDRTKAELDALKAKQTPPAVPVNGAEPIPGFDPADFASRLLSQVYGANAMSNASQALRSEFPKADPGLFSPERLATYGSVEALRIAVEADHNRVAGLLSADLEAEKAAIRAEFVKAYGADLVPGPTGAGAPAAGGDPTPAQLVAMTLAELDEFEKAHPGVAERVLRSAA